MEILPTDPARIKEYETANWVPSKVLLPDGSVVDTLPVEVTIPPISVEEAVYDERMDDYSTVNVIYKGWAAPGSSESSSVWRIRKTDMTTGIVKTFAGGSSDFKYRWDQRLTLF